MRVNRTKKRDKGFVYVVSAPNGYVKVGMAGNPFERFTMIQCNSPLPVRLVYVCECANPVEIEIAAHNILDGFRRHREWFEVSAEMAIDALRSSIRLAGSDVVSAPHRSETRRPGIGGMTALLRPDINETACLLD